MYETQSLVVPIDDLPNSEYWKALEGDEQLRTFDLNASRSCHNSLDKIDQEYQEELYAIIGKQNLLAYQEEQKRRLESMQNAERQCPLSYEGLIQLEDLRNDISSKARKLFSELGIDSKKAISLQREYQEKISDAFFNTIRKSRFASVKPPTNNQTYRPPFAGWRWWYSWEKTPVERVNRPSHFRWLNHNSGELGSYTFLRVDDSDEADRSHILYRTAVRLWHRVTNTGTLRIRVRLEAVHDSYWGRIVNEPGHSSVDVEQDLQVYAQLVSPSPIVGATSFSRFYDRFHGRDVGPYRDRNRSDHSWSRSWPSGEVTVLIDEVFERGTWLYVEVGIENFNRFFANDCSVTSGQTLRYIIREVGMSSSGD